MLDMTAQGDDPFLGKVMLGRYRPFRLLGEGGMGRVYVAEQKMGSTSRNVAIKTLHPELSKDPEILKRFHRECEIVIKLTHPNTIQFYDFGELEDKTLFIVMEYIEGVSLATLLESGKIDLHRIDKMLVQICGSLHEAHGHGIVHRDLKPDNILLTNRGGQTDFVKVLDFGIAKRDEAEDDRKTKLTKQGMVLGTPPYMSPEQFSGLELDARSDVYSLGIILYEMMTGVLPFKANTPWEWATRHLTDSPAPFEQHPGADQIPQEKKEVVFRALSKNREERYGSTLELLSAFTGMHDPSAAWTAVTGNVQQRSGTPGYSTPTNPQAPYQARVSQNTPSGVKNSSSQESQQINPYASTQRGLSEELLQPSSGSFHNEEPVLLPKKKNSFMVFAMLLVAGAILALMGWQFLSKMKQTGKEIVQPETPDAGTLQATPTKVALPPEVPQVPSVDSKILTPTKVVEVIPPSEENTNPPSVSNQTLPTKVELPRDPVTSPTRPSNRPPSTPQNGRQGIASLALGEQALASRNWATAMSLCKEVEVKSGRAPARNLRRRIESQGAIALGQMVMANRCRDARSLYDLLKSQGFASRAAKNNLVSCQ